MEVLESIARRMALVNGRTKVTTQDVAASIRAYAKAWAIAHHAPDTVPATAMEIALAHYRRTAASIGGELDTPFAEPITLF
jgi:hypothetical protein